MTLGETFMKPSTMLYRNLLAMEAEEALRSYPADGVVLMGGCDKTVPALVMGATSANLPALFVPAGPMLRGNWRGQILGSGSDVWKYWTERRAGTLDECSWREMEDGIARSYGHLHDDGHGIDDGVGRGCAGPDAAGRVVYSCRRLGALARWPPPAGRRIVEMVWEDLKPRDILTTAAFENAVTAAMALGGSTNAIIHLIAMAGPGRRRARPRSLRCAVAADAVPREHPAVGQVPDGGLLLRRAACAACSIGCATACTSTA